MGDGTVPVMREIYMLDERAPRCPLSLALSLTSVLTSRPRGGTRGGETRDTKPFSDLVFRDSALKYPRPIN